MIKTTKEQKGSALVLRLSGSIDETVNWDDIIGPPPSEIQLITKEVFRINSVGVKGFIKYFQGLKNKGTKIKFQECSPAFVEQINLISNFSCGAEIESIYIPFSCVSCHSELIALFKSADLKIGALNIPELKCTKCGGKAVFDDIEDEYFAFLKR